MGTAAYVDLGMLMLGRLCAGAGVGKGRTIAGLVLENWRRSRKRHLWLTIGTDLRIDSRRDLDDVGATDIPLHPLNKLPYGQLDSEKVWRWLAFPGSSNGLHAPLSSMVDKGVVPHKAGYRQPHAMEPWTQILSSQAFAHFRSA